MLRILIFILALALCPATVSDHLRTETPRRFEFTQLLMGVEARITLYAPDENAAREAAAAGFQRIAELDAALSDYRPDSELMRLCDRAGEGPQPVSDDLFRVLARAGIVSAESGGAFDVTVGPLVAHWREARRTGRLPHPPDLREARTRVGWNNVRLDAPARTVELTCQGMRLDLGGIAKGYAAQQAVEALRAKDAARCLVALSGDIAVGDPPPDAPGWSIALELGGEPAIVILANSSISTSGDTEQFVEVDGERYSHVLDPRTGLGVRSRTRATVIAPDGATADALASALTVLGPPSAPDLLARFPGAVAVVEAAETARAVRYTSPDFPPRR